MPKTDRNIRSIEERYGGQGHAGEDPYAGPRADPHHDIPPDPSVELPNATLHELIDKPDPELPYESDQDPVATNDPGESTGGKRAGDDPDAKPAR